MLQIVSVYKQYRTGDFVTLALNNVSLNLRDSEFVSILGPSGSGKTTLLNIIGGLDRYDAGDLVINGTSTMSYQDRDWDSYRNHTIGFVFQSYNLIPHQTVLANVELALTISGVPKRERRERAVAALNEVGLGDHINKRPNQLSGGQMQRVAIARALVNDPAIVLADEPTGALDSETSVQVMEILRSVSQRRLVVMVTHNAELAERYSTRIVRLRDGKIVSDTKPFVPGMGGEYGQATTMQAGQSPMSPQVPPQQGWQASQHQQGMRPQIQPQQQMPSQQAPNLRPGRPPKVGMGFLTSMSLSTQNLLTKKGRTILTAFAGSIGIIGIALIVAMSSSVSDYVSDVQRDTMVSYPITIEKETIDFASMMTANMEVGMREAESQSESEEAPSAASVSYAMLEAQAQTNAAIVKNDLRDFKKYLDDPDSEIHEYVGENGITYAYDIPFDAYAYDAAGLPIDTSADPDDGTADDIGGFEAEDGPVMSAMTGASAGAKNFSEMPVLSDESDGNVPNQTITDNYELIYGNWPQEPRSVVAVVGSDGTIPADVARQIGFLSQQEYDEAKKAIEDGGDPKVKKISYETLCDMRLTVLPECEQYVRQENGRFKPFSGNPAETKALLDAKGIPVKVSGVIRLKPKSNIETPLATFAYLPTLTDEIIERANSSEIVTAQEASPDVSVLTGMRFSVTDDAQKAENAKTYLLGLGVSEKASAYTALSYANPGQFQTGTQVMGDPAGAMPTDQATVPQVDANGMPIAVPQVDANGMPTVDPMATTAMQATVPTMPTDDASMAQELDAWLYGSPDQGVLVGIYDRYAGDATLESTLERVGKADKESPSSISIYADSFEDKDAITECINRYNEKVEDESQRIEYTDYVALITGSVTSIINIISYVLIAFVAVSLVVSCIMIGIITHISVMERTKEIGILRALGASRRNISQVFNAETAIIGALSGVIGVGIAALLTIPITAILQSAMEVEEMSVTLPPLAALVLVGISVAVTVLGGIAPSRKAAWQDPVVALRTE